jgi:hypothetical protein
VSADYLQVLKAVAVVIAFIGTIVGLVGLVFVSLRYHYIRYTKKTYLLAFLTGPLAWFLGDKDSSKYQIFKSRIRFFLPLFVLSTTALVSLSI